MQINDIFDLSQYDEAYKFVSENKGTIIQDLGDGQYQLIAIPEPSLDELKQQKHDEINAERDKAEQGGFEYMGKTFDSDQVSCIRMTCAAQSLQAVSLQEGLGDITITWTCQDNSTIDLNAEQLSGLVIALAQWSNKCHQRATELKEQVELAQSQEELEKIVWTLE